MPITMHSASVPIFTRMLVNVNTWLGKAEDHANAKKVDTAVFLASRLAIDMLPFKNQIQIACDGAKFCIARLAGIDAPKFDDNESTLAELRDRISATIAFIKSVPAGQIDGSEEKEIVVPRRDGSITMKGEAYLKNFALPNFFFHTTTVYALLRHNGVPLGKSDYLGAMDKG